MAWTNAVAALALGALGVYLFANAKRHAEDKRWLDAKVNTTLGFKPPRSPRWYLWGERLAGALLLVVAALAVIDGLG